MTTRDIEVGDGTRIAYQDLGAGPAVLFVPGFGLDHTLWDRQVRVLAGDHRTVCVDQRGHGSSDTPLDGYDLDRLAADLADVLDALGLTAVTVVGHSLGGTVAFRLAVTRPDLVGGLVLVGSTGVRASRSEEYPFGRPPQESLDAVLAAETADRPGSRRRALACFAGEPPPATLEWLFGMSMRMPSWAAAGCFRTLLESDQVADLGAIAVPVLLCLGQDDPVQSMRGARWVCDRLDGARLVELPACGHYPMLEAADALDEALAGFLAGVASR